MIEPRPQPGRTSHAAPARVEVGEEREALHGWSYKVTVRRDGVEASHSVTLTWRDHDYWCGGASAPSRVVQAVLEYALAHDVPPLPRRFDAARIRRWLPQIDSEIRSLIPAP